MIATVLLQLIQTTETSATRVNAQGDIVVTGKRLADTYANCLERGCTPAQDAKVTIALAEQRLREGQYVAAKDMLAKAVARNRKFEKAFPRSLAALYERPMQCGETLIVRRIHVRTPSEEQIYARRIALVCRPHKRRMALRIWNIHRYILV